MTSIRNQVATAIWAHMSVDRDKCDLDIHDLGQDDILWLATDAAISALAPILVEVAIPFEALRMSILQRPYAEIGYQLQCNLVSAVDLLRSVIAPEEIGTNDKYINGFYAEIDAKEISQ